MKNVIFVSAVVTFGSLASLGCTGGSEGGSGAATGGSTSHASSSSSSSGHGTGGGMTTTSSSSTSSSSTSSSSGGMVMYAFTTFDGPAGAPTTVNGINNDGEAVGFTTSMQGMDSVNANFIRKADGTFTSLDLGDPAGSANALNQAREVVGAANGSAFLLVNGGTPATALAPFGMASSVALGVSDMGVVVGQYAADAMHSPGFVDVQGTFTTVSPTAASVMTFVQGVNNAGLAIGFYSEDGTTQHGFTYDINAKQTTILADPSTARTAGGNLVLTQFLGINDSRKAVGYYQTMDGSQFGFLYDLDAKAYTFLDHPQAAPVNGVQITQITGIDDAGEIAGFFIDAQGAQHGFVAKPSP